MCLIMTNAIHETKKEKRYTKETHDTQKRVTKKKHTYNRTSVQPHIHKYTTKTKTNKTIIHIDKHPNIQPRVHTNDYAHERASKPHETAKTTNPRITDYINCMRLTRKTLEHET
jgi:hypothetical protein